MNIEDYNRRRTTHQSRVAANSTRKEEQIRENRTNRRKKKKGIRLDKLIGYITIVTIVVFACMIYSDIKKPRHAAQSQISDNDIVATEKVTAKNIQKVNTGAQYNKKIVYIDAGHGGADAGAQYGKYLEKDQTLEMAKLVQKELDGKGVQVVMSRTSDIDISLEDRLKAAQNANAGIMVSIHRNYYEGKSTAKGVEAWINSSQPVDSKNLAGDILNQLIKTVKFENRGIKTGTIKNSKTNYYLNTDKAMTSCIIELGFITDQNDNKIVTQNKTACAKGIAQGIMNYINEVEKN